MTYTIKQLVKSIAAQLSATYPDFPVYRSANQQKTRYPCFFIFLMPSSIFDEIDVRERRDIAFDVVFVQARNIPDADAQIQDIADGLDYLFDTVAYTSPEGESVPLHTHERTWSIEDQELHYKFHIKQRVAKPVEEQPMLTITRLTVNDNGGGEYETDVGGDIAVTPLMQISVLRTVGG